MDNFLSLIHSDDLVRVLSGTFDISQVPVEKHRGIFLMASHCCLNGPVGTNKPTTFPLLPGTISISGYIGNRVSNNSWRSFCQEIAGVLLRSYPNIVADSQQHKVAGGLWPVAKSISEVRK